MINETSHSEKFIQQKAGKETGFRVSKNYFETLEDDFSIRLFEEKNRKPPAFETPVDYFNTLENSILKRTTKEPKVISLKNRFLQIIPFAAVASVVIFIGINSFQFGDIGVVNFDSITDNEIENWLENNSSNSITEDIVSIVSEAELLENEFAFTNISDSTIESYLYTNEEITIIQELY